jgi:hypothetical protein
MKKIAIISLLLIIAGMMFACNNHNNNDKKIAEEFVLRHYVAYGILCTINRTTYDPETGRYTIYLKGNEKDIIATVDIEESVVTSFNLGNGRGEYTVIHDTPTIIKMSPGKIVIEYDFSKETDGE